MRFTITLLVLAALATCVQGQIGGSLVKNLARGAVLRVACDLTAGLPLEQWKTRLARMKNESAYEAFLGVGRYQGGFPAGYWKCLGPKCFENSLSGAALLAGKEGARQLLVFAGAGPVMAGIFSGVAGGLSQTVVMGPCTLLLTMSAARREPPLKILRDILEKDGPKGLYKGATAVAFRQITNWASRQGITDAVRGWMLPLKPKNIEGPWMTGEILCGVVGGILSCWNTPIEVLRITSQSNAAKGVSMPLHTMLVKIVKEEGISGLFRGLPPRLGQATWTTIFMCVGPRLLSAWLDGANPSCAVAPVVHIVRAISSEKLCTAGVAAVCEEHGCVGAADAVFRGDLDYKKNQ